MLGNLLSKKTKWYILSSKHNSIWVVDIYSPMNLQAKELEEKSYMPNLLNHPLLGVVYSGLTTPNEKKNLWERRSRIAFSYYVQSQGRLICILPQTNRIVQRLGAVHSFHSLFSIHDCLLVLCSIQLLRDAIESPNLCTLVMCLHSDNKS